MPRALLVLFLALVVAVPASAATRSTGLRGLVTRGPVTPVCQEGVPCSAPSKHTTLTFTRNGVVRSAVTGDDGRYSILLHAGSWVVRIPSAKFGFQPKTVTVVAGRMTARNFSIDTGIR
jgi:hypothetical protein